MGRPGRITLRDLAPGSDLRGVARLLPGGAVLAALASLALAWLPLETALGHLLHEDCFYYLKLAENLLLGHGATLDGSAPTNGFHPLWLALVVALRSLSDHDLVLRLVLVAAAALHAAQAALLFSLVRARAGATLAWLAALFLLCNFRLVACNLCGLETPLAGVAFLLLVRELERRPAPDLAQAARLGALAGVAALARFDLLLVGLVVLVGLALARSRAGLGAGLARLAASGAACLLVLAPWLAWSWSHSGSWLPASHAALRLWLFQPPQLGLDAAQNLARIGRKLEEADRLLPAMLNALGLWPLAPSPWSPGPAFAGLLVILPLLLLAKQVIRPCNSRGPAPTARLLAAWALLHFFYYLLFARPEVRYLLPFVLAVLLLASWQAGELLARAPRLRMPLAAAFVLLLATSGVAGVSAWRRQQGAGEWHALHPDLYRAARWIAAHTRPDVVVGGFNVGILSYHSERTVVNLDGVMNDEAFEALRQRRLADYVDRRGIALLVDLPGEIVRFMDGFGGDPAWRGRFAALRPLPPPVVALRRRSAQVLLPGHGGAPPARRGAEAPGPGGLSPRRGPRPPAR